jgi:ubiquinone/menaquinone biosynthesis C-methylase UbiE
MFKKIASQLRKPNGLLGKLLSMVLRKMNSSIYDKVIDDIEAKQGEHIFEIGYGHGAGIERIVSKVNCQVSGIDFSEVMYKDASKLLKKYIAQGNVNLDFGDFLDFKMPSNTFNTVFCVNVIYFWDDLLNPFNSINRSLKNDGVFLIYMDSLDDIKNSRFTDTHNFNHYNKEVVLEQLGISGFKSTSYDFERGHIIRAIKA